MKCCVLILIFLLLIKANNDGMKVYLFTAYMDAWGPITVADTSSWKSSGILKPSFRSTYPTNLNQTVTILAPSGCGILAAIRQLDLRPRNLDTLKIFPSDDIRSAVVFSNPLYYQNNSVDPYETNVVYAPNGELTVNFITGNGSSLSYNGFELIFTAYRECTSYFFYEYTCLSPRCISESLICDGHNHCGDRSDQTNCPTPSPNTTPNANTVAIVLGIILLVAAVACIAFIVRKAIRSRTKSSTIIQPPPLNSSTNGPSSYPEPGYHPPSYPQP